MNSSGGGGFARRVKTPSKRNKREAGQMKAKLSENLLNEKVKSHICVCKI